MLEWLGLLGNAIVLVISLLVLDRASDLTITNSVRIAELAGYAKTTIGFLLVAFCTSLPALSVSVFSALNVENIGVAIGNALGSNIVNVCLILGVCIIWLTFKKSDKVMVATSITKTEIGSLYFGLFVGSTIPLTLIYIGYASRFIGVAFLLIFVLYTFQLSRTRNVKEETTTVTEKRNLRHYGLLAFASAAIVVVVAYLIVDSASFIAQKIGVPHVVIGATVVAFGTSIPVLMTSIRAVQKGHFDLALGNIVGTCFVDTTCILGATLVVSPLRVDMAVFSSLVMFSVIANLFLWYFLSSEKIGWREGVVLLFLYFLFLAVSFGGYRV